MRSLLASSLLAGSILLLALAPVALAHGDDEAMDMGAGGMDHMAEAPHGSAGNATNATAEAIVYPPTYFSHPEHRSLMYAHIVLMTVGWVFALPVCKLA